MVPTIRPSAKTSIFAPTRCGVDPRVETTVTSAAGSPRSSASATAAKTSWFISIRSIIWPAYGWPRSVRHQARARVAGEHRVGVEARLEPVDIAGDDRLGAGKERFANDRRTAGGRELAVVAI